MLQSEFASAMLFRFDYNGSAIRSILHLYRSSLRSRKDINAWGTESEYPLAIELDSISNVDGKT